MRFSVEITLEELLAAVLLLASAIRFFSNWSLRHNRAMTYPHRSGAVATTVEYAPKASCITAGYIQGQPVAAVDADPVHVSGK
jgi:hypothetical protein